MVKLQDYSIMPLQPVRPMCLLPMSLLILLMVARRIDSRPNGINDVEKPSYTENSKFIWIGNKHNHLNNLAAAQGPNVCALEEVIGNSRRKYYSECMAFAPRKICQKPTFIRYRCCTGFEKDNGELTDGCQAVKPVVNLTLSLNDLHLTEFRNHMKTADSRLGLLKTKEDVYTLFAPQNKAFKNLTDNISELLSVESPPEENLIMYHVTANRYDTSVLRNNVRVPTLYRDNKTLHIHRYANGILTANCVRIILPNQPATNGIIHITEKVLKPVDDRTSVMDILLNDERTGEFVTALVLTQIANDLRSQGHFTVFAPTDEAFRNMSQETAQRIMADNELIKKLLLFHIVDCCICSAAILGPANMRTLEGQKVNLTCDVDDKLVVHGVTCFEVDAVGHNGVIHFIDTVLIPDSVKTIGEMAAELGLHEFINFARQAGLKDILDAKDKTEFTLFAPSDEAFEQLSEGQLKLLKTHKRELRRVLEYHVIRGRISTSRMIGTETLETGSRESSTATSVKVFITVYNNREFGVNNAKIVHANYEVANGVIHVIDQVLMPGNTTILSRVKDNVNLSVFQSLLQLSGFDKVLSRRDGKWTLFAPSNAAFKQLPEEELESLRSNKDELKLFLQYHMLEKAVYPSGLRPKLLYRYETSAKEWITLRQEGSSEVTTIRVNRRSTIVKSDLEIVNGVLYVIDQVLQCPCIQKDPAYE